MKHVSTSATFLTYARRGALLLALGAAGPAAWGQSFGLVSTYSTGASGNFASMALGDINGDGRLDAVTSNSSAHNVVVLQGQTGGGLLVSGIYATGTGSSPRGVVLGDVNGDGRLDVITANYGTSSVGILLGQTGGGLAAAGTYSVGLGSGPKGVVTGDVNGDGRLDIITANADADNIGVLLGQVGGGFATVNEYTTGTGSSPRGVVLGDVNGDGRLDVITANYGTSSVGVLLGQTGGGLAAVSAYATSEPLRVAVGDVNGDGRRDIITTNFNTSTVGVLLGQMNGGFAPVSTYTTGSSSNPQGLVLGDVTGDGRLDIITANYGANAVGVLPSQMSGGFATVSAYPIPLPAFPTDVALGDVNGDGRPDIFTIGTYPFTAGNAFVGILLNTGTYTPLATTSANLAAQVTLAPNPTHDAFTVQLPAGLAPTQAELLNALGQAVRRPAVGAGSFRVETNGLAPGVYTLRLLTGGAALARRVVVE